MSQTTATKILGKEYPSPEEPAIIAEMVSDMKGQMDRMYTETKMLRQVHTKMHGCVKASFIIEENLPEELKVGVFSEAKEFHAWVRFSNASTRPKMDKKKDIRGIAIKLMDVPGDKILEDKIHEKTQDFLLMTKETFFCKNLLEFRGTMKAVTAKSKIKLIAYFLNPFHWGLVGRLMKSMKKAKNPLNLDYWSTQPYRFGAEDKAVKYFLKPSKSNKIINEDCTDDNFLKVNMSQTLNTGAVEFDFFVQLQTNADMVPIEDPTVPWTSEFQKVATLKIIKQDFDSAEQMTYGENLSFNAWHSLPIHRPLGSFNRARKVAYESMSKFRHEKNQIPMVEPIDSDDFLEAPFKN